MRKELNMTKKEMITKIVENQIERGIIKEERKAFIIRGHLKGGCGLPPMSKRQIEDCYIAIFGA